MSTPEDKKIKVVAVLLAAGAGRRFDPSGQHNKLLATVNGDIVAVRAARNLQMAGLTVVAVVRPGDNSPACPLRDLGCLVTTCDKANLGMGHSLAHGVNCARQALQPDAIVVALADMPFLNPDIIADVCDAVSPAQSIVAAAVNGERGHPVAFWHTHFDALTQLKGDNGAGKLLQQYPVTLIETSDNAVIRDIDLPKDLPD